MMACKSVVAITLSLAFAASAAAAPPVTGDGTVTAPAVSIPFSDLASSEARAMFVRDIAINGPAFANVAAARAHYDRINSDRAQRMRLLYPVKIDRETIGGVATEIIAPMAGVPKRNADRVLINLHGGAFLWGSGSGAEVEAIPIASVANIKVVAVDYRMAPEHRFPAASDDAVAVYRALLKRYKPGNIGIYGCSAGAILTAQTVASIARQKLPRPGAIGTFCGALADLTGDSTYTAPILAAQPPQTGPRKLNARTYFENADSSDPLVLPINSKSVLARFPPTLLITATRDFAMSSVVKSHSELVKAGVDAELHVWEGVWHSFFSDPELPESKEAYSVIADFFDRHLGR